MKDVPKTSWGKAPEPPTPLLFEILDQVGENYTYLVG